MSRIDRDSFALGVYTVAALWSLVRLGAATDTSSYVIELVLTAAFAGMAAWTFKLTRKRSGSVNATHIDTEGPYAALRCTGCGQHLVYIEHGHDLIRLASARDRHECAAEVALKGGDDA
ncbi:hypothetical protein [Streptomyces sp.]|uniref:hypothetical protein n=1 Tax=Streptomyces sp. TaxID=1931 RepID=UPI002F94AECB